MDFEILKSKPFRNYNFALSIFFNIEAKFEISFEIRNDQNLKS